MRKHTSGHFHRPFVTALLQPTGTYWLLLNDYKESFTAFIYTGKRFINIENRTMTDSQKTFHLRFGFSCDFIVFPPKLQSCFGSHLFSWRKTFDMFKLTSGVIWWSLHTLNCVFYFTTADKGVSWLSASVCPVLFTSGFLFLIQE